MRNKMAFKFLKERQKEREEKFYNSVQEKTMKRAYLDGSPITLEEYKEMRMNSYDRRVLEPLFDDEVLLEIIEYALAQEGNSEFDDYKIPSSYTESVLRVHIHELIRGFKNLKNDSCI